MKEMLFVVDAHHVTQEAPPRPGEQILIWQAPMEVAPGAVVVLLAGH